MRFEHLDLNLLVALDILLDECNITRAADRLNLSQSATSGVLRRLRLFFEDDLLVQVGRKMQPTDYALQLQQPVRDVIIKIRSSIVVPKHFDPASSKRHFRLIAADFIVTILLQDALRQIQKAAPHMTFEILSPGHASDSLFTRGEVDFLLAPQPYLIDGQPSNTLFEEDLVCVVCANKFSNLHRLNCEQYQQFGHVSVGFGSSGQLSIEEDFLRQHGIQRRIEIISSDFNTLPQLVMGTHRIATMHRRLAEYFAKHYPVRVLPTPIELPTMKEKIQWHNACENDPVHRWVKQQIITAAQALTHEETAAPTPITAAIKSIR